MPARAEDHPDLTGLRKISLATGVSLNVALAGPADAPPVILLHGFPESHRTWREIVPLLEDRFRLIMPDQRGFAGSDMPQDVEAYATETLIDDIFALADALNVERFALVGHDWGGAIVWAAALRGDPRLTRLAIVNAPHPAIFQKSLIEDSDQRAASQYITMFRSPGAVAAIEAMGLETFFDKVLASHSDRSKISEAERRQYLADWSRPGALTAMLNWYRASKLVVPPPGITVPLPNILLHFSGRISIPTLVVWGMADTALLPVQLDGLGEIIDDVTLVRIPDAGHFAPWEAPDRVAAALAPFLGREPAATAPAA